MHNADRVPFVGGGFDIGAGELNAFAVHDFVKAEVVLQWIHADNVIVIGILVAPYGTAPLIFLAVNGLEGERQIEIGDAALVGDA